MFFGGLNDPSEKLRREQKREMEKRAAATARMKAAAMKAAPSSPPPPPSSSRSKNVIDGDEEKTRRRKGKKKKFNVLWKANLRCEIDDIAAKRGIRARQRDKIQLPSSALRTLERLDFETRQPAFFYVRAVGNENENDRDENDDEEVGCYCAALDYQANENCVVVPRDLAKRLGYSLLEKEERVEKRVLRVEFRSRALEKCEWVKLQPVSNEFSKFLSRHPEADVKMVLEQILVQRSVVHVGDVFEVNFSGFVSSSSSPSESFVFELKVVALKVEGGEEDTVASLIETDVEVDLAPSIEHDEVVERIETLNRNDEEEKRREREKKLAEEREARARLERNEERKEKLRRYREAMAKKLPLEPPASSSTNDNVVRVRISLPSGEAIDRRFFKHDDVSSLFDFVSASYSFEEEEEEEDSDVKREFCLVTRGGRFGGDEKKKRICRSSGSSRSSSSIGAAGVESGDVLLVEKLNLI